MAKLKSLIWPSFEPSDSMKAKLAEVEMIVRRSDRKDDERK